MAAAPRRGIEFFELADDGSQSEIKPLCIRASKHDKHRHGRRWLSFFFLRPGHARRGWPALSRRQCHESGCSNQDVEMVVFSDIPAPLAIALSDDLRLFLHSRYRPEIYWVQLPT